MSLDDIFCRHTLLCKLYFNEKLLPFPIVYLDQCMNIAFNLRMLQISI